ncbi:phytoene/squalene synthase family protein [Leptobacterium sp. I13]|uniref:phytoene/squalene synthase family protein n=1 Tax=Leptobacterium meishanense TaxID=3128904 RepID=UPI0030EB6C00
MDPLYNKISHACSKKVTATYSTSFSLAVRMLAPSIRQAIHNIYGFVRFADEIVDTFHEWDKKYLLDKFEEDFYEALEMGISLNPILNSFQQTVKEYHIDRHLVDAFLKSMRMDLVQGDYVNRSDYETYIYGSADVVGLMCLKVFVNGDAEKYEALKESAMRLGSAFQKVNFLRDLKSDIEILNRSYFPNVDLNNLSFESKQVIIAEIEEDFREAYKGIVKLPKSSKFGVYTAFIYYKKLLHKLKRTPTEHIMDSRIRVSNPIKLSLLVKSYFNIKLNLV